MTSRQEALSLCYLTLFIHGSASIDQTPALCFGVQPRASHSLTSPYILHLRLESDLEMHCSALARFHRELT